VTFAPAPRTAPLDARLQAFSFASGLREEAQARLRSVVRVRHFPEDAVLVRPGQECVVVPFVERGHIRVARDGSRDRSRELLLYDVCPGEACVLALTGALRQVPYPAEATAAAGTDAIFVPAAELRSLFTEEPAVQRYVVDVFASRLTDLMQLADEVAFGSIETRLARLLLREAHAQKVALTHAELASMLGTAREVVSRTLDKMQRRGWVQLGRRRVTLRDPEALRQLAPPPPPKR